MRKHEWNMERLVASVLDGQPEPVGDDAIVSPASVLSAGRADCCSAQALFRALMPARGPRTQPAELFFCGHHLRVSRAALRDAAAAVFDAEGRLVASAH